MSTSSSSKPAPTITLHFLQASRAIRTAWLLSLLSLPYTLNFSPRLDRFKAAPPEFKKASGNPLGKFPTLTDTKDGSEIVIHESGAITDYLLSVYDSGADNSLGLAGKTVAEKAEIGTWVHASEGAFMLHSLAILYATWNLEPAFVAANQAHIDKMVAGMSVNVQKDFDWLEATLSDGREWLVGGRVTAADVMVMFSVDFILARDLGTKGCEGRWGKTREWLERCKREKAYVEAVEKTGYTLWPEE